MNLDIAPTDRPADASESATAVPARLAIIDGDFHPAPRAISDLRPFMTAQMWELLSTVGTRRRHGMSLEPYPKSAPNACRRDAWPESGGPPGSDIGLIRSQYLDAYGIEYALMAPLGITGQGELNGALSAALASAVNDWQRVAMTGQDKRLRAGLVVPFEEPDASVREIERCADDPAFAQVFMLTRSSVPLGNPRFWPIYAAAERHGLPVAFHVFGAGGHPYTGAGWPSFYIEEGAGHSTSCQTVITSLVMEGVLERFPKLKIVIVEGGFGWLPSLTWRLDRLFDTMRTEVPHLKRRPSEYIRQQIWLTTQPMEEPDNRQHLIETMEAIGYDRLLFASDYPHWDFDDPFRAFPASVPKDNVRQIFAENGKAVYRL
jgi:uncharacterized protein